MQKVWGAIVVVVIIFVAVVAVKHRYHVSQADGSSQIPPAADRTPGYSRTVKVNNADDEHLELEAFLDGPDGTTTIANASSTVTTKYEKKGDMITGTLLTQEGLNPAGKSYTTPVSEVKAHLAGLLVTSCSSNLINLKTAVQMFSTENGGHFPQSLDQLVPKYLKTLPTCPSARRDTYSSAYAVASNPDAFTIVCGGDSHKLAVPPNFPQYISTRGLLRDPDSPVQAR